LRRKPLMRRIGFCDNEKPRRVLIDPVDNTRPCDAADTRQATSAMMEERVDQRAIEIPGRGMHDEARRFVDDKKMIVLKDNFERNVLRDIMGGNGVWHINFKRQGRINFRRRVADGSASATDVPGRNQRLNPFTRQRRNAIRQRAVEPPADMIFAQLHRKSGKACAHRYCLGAMQVRMTSELHARLLAEAAGSPAHEVCGLLIGDDRIDAIVPTANVATDTRRAFEIDPKPLFDAIRTERAGGSKLFGAYHSHPEGPPHPSPRDHAQAAGDDRIWLIIGQGQVTAWVSHQVGELESVELVIDTH
jgi:desampylase